MFVAASSPAARAWAPRCTASGMCPTPALAFVTDAGSYGAGVMVSASHNPADDNGLKVLDATGMKLDDEIEDKLEALVWRADELASPTNAGLGREVDARGRARPLPRASPRPGARTRSQLEVALDCANGSGCEVAPEILAGTGATSTAYFDQPDGVNINVDCGATAPGSLAGDRGRRGVDVGFALDGDADRCVTVDERGRSWTATRLIGHHRPGPPRPRRARRLHRRAERALQRRPGRSDRGSRRPRGRAPPSATSTSSRPCRSRAPASAGRRAAT